jgi:hypothetical protein
MDCEDSRNTTNTAEEAKGWTYCDNMVTSDQALQDWTIQILAVWRCHHLRKDSAEML